jgi:nucleoid-associated protein YgaU
MYSLCSKPKAADQKISFTTPRASVWTRNKRQGASAWVRDFSEATRGSPSSIPYRREMENSFGADFSRVKAHLGRKESLDRLNANAATSGEQVAFADSLPDKKLVAHELTHVLQQRGGRAARWKGLLSAPDDPSEREAASVGDAAAAGRKVIVASPATSAIQRDIKDKKLQVPLGNFEIDMKSYFSKGFSAGEDGKISFTPNDKAPDCKSIRLAQSVRTFDPDAKKEFDWLKADPMDVYKKSKLSKMRTSAGDGTHTTAKGDTLKAVAQQHYGDDSRFAEIFAANKKALASAMKTADGDKTLPEGLSLTIPKAVAGGFAIDHSTEKLTPRTAKKDPAVLPDYMLKGEEVAGTRQHGSKAGKSIVPAMIDDRPGGGFHILYTFETTARCHDTNDYYGAIRWSFDSDPDVGVTKETHSVAPGVSDTFRAALGEFNKFYKNPPTGP